MAWFLTGHRPVLVCGLEVGDPDPIHEHGISLHLFRSSLISLNNVLCFSVFKAYASFVKYIPEYLLFNAVVSGIVSLFNF